MRKRNQIRFIFWSMVVIQIVVSLTFSLLAGYYASEAWEKFVGTSSTADVFGYLASVGAAGALVMYVVSCSLHHVFFESDTKLADLGDRSMWFVNQQDLSRITARKVITFVMAFAIVVATAITMCSCGDRTECASESDTLVWAEDTPDTLFFYAGEEHEFWCYENPDGTSEAFRIKMSTYGDTLAVDDKVYNAVWEHYQHKMRQILIMAQISPTNDSLITIGVMDAPEIVKHSGYITSRKYPSIDDPALKQIVIERFSRPMRKDTFDIKCEMVAALQPLQQ